MCGDVSLLSLWVGPGQKLHLFNSVLYRHVSFSREHFYEPKSFSVSIL